MSDIELLKRAASAAGIFIDTSSTNGGGRGNTGFTELGAGKFAAKVDCHNGVLWNPLWDDGDALRLAVQLRIEIQHWPTCVLVFNGRGPATREECDDASRAAATRRAIVRAAAALSA